MSEEEQDQESSILNAYHASIKESAKGHYYIGSVSVTTNSLKELEKDLVDAILLVKANVDELNKWVDKL